MTHHRRLAHGLLIGVCLSMLTVASADGLPTRDGGHVCDAPCMFMGNEIPSGSTLALDRCNTCDCLHGVLTCTELVCDAPCDFLGKEIPSGSTAPLDACNTCDCLHGVLTCTELVCDAPCEFMGKEIPSGSVLGVGCYECTCQHGVLDCSSTCGAPGEASPAGDMRASRSLSSIDVTFAPACSATDHAVYWGLGPIDCSLDWLGSACGLGTGGSAAFDPGVSPAPGEFLFFVVVGYDLAAEGSYGVDSTPAARPEATGIGACDQSLGATTCQ